ncbi:LytTR family DNA-binding domain-containing protein [Prevotella sp. 10(H)]|uniref:LytR/AlgR family response regulator transcription factor n=1 Tax=Prevotella sp. 10(H) TaxID=1158294 RepID=UPI0004A6C4F1|nr:LytTR family DNA-binding domain-containing protein [Prevotella sp. 10(H)]
MKNIIDYLKQPFPYYHKNWLIVAAPTVWIFLLTYILEPLGLSSITYKLKVVIIITLITTISAIIVVYIFPRIFKKFYNPENWKIYKLLSYGLFISSLSIPATTYYVYSIYLKECPNIIHTRTELMFFWFPIAWFIAIVPTLIIFIQVKQTWATEKQDEAITSSEISCIEETEEREDIISITINAREKLEIIPQDFLYAEAQGNYVIIFYIDNNEVRRKSSRATISNMTEILCKHFSIARCHRTYIVNTSYICNIRSQSQTYTLTLTKTNAEIPVSRSYLKTIKSLVTLQLPENTLAHSSQRACDE